MNLKNQLASYVQAFENHPEIIHISIFPVLRAPNKLSNDILTIFNFKLLSFAIFLAK